MPTFESVDIETTVTVDVDFEVYCGRCNKGICSESETRKSRDRRYLQVVVNACPYCMKEKDDEIKELEYRIKELEIEIEKGGAPNE